MSAFTQFDPGSILEIRQIHNKAQAVEGKIYWGRAEDNSIHQYRGTHEGRLKDETNLIDNEDTTDDNVDRLDGVDTTLEDHEDRIESIEETLPTKADKCGMAGMIIALG